MSPACRHFVDKQKAEFRPELKHTKTFVPIFPHLYDSLDNGFYLSKQNQRCSLFGTRNVKVQKDSESDPVDIKVHKLTQIKFAVKDNNLLKYEETRKNQIEL